MSLSSSVCSNLFRPCCAESDTEEVCGCLRRMMRLPFVTVTDGVKEILRKAPFQKYLQPNCEHEKKLLVSRSYTSTVRMSRDWSAPNVNPKELLETDKNEDVTGLSKGPVGLGVTGGSDGLGVTGGSDGSGVTGGSDGSGVTGGTSMQEFLTRVSCPLQTSHSSAAESHVLQWSTAHG